jgi:3-oxoacyl-[acyl-carrier protein] reductase
MQASEATPPRVALVTGAGGIGRAVAHRLAAAGYPLALADLRPEPLRALAAELPAEPLVWAGDLTDEAAVGDLFGQILGRYGRLEVAVNTAGLLRTTRLEAISKAEWDSVVDANLGSAFLVCRECCEPMRRQGWGRIINFSSVAGQVGGILSGAHYAASKAAIISLTRSVAKVMAPHGVRCNALAPAGVETEMLRQYSDEQRASLVAGIPAGRFATPEEIAEIVFWLTTPGADYITGQTLNVNGGSYLG